MQRSLPSAISKVDSAEAREVGRKAVEFATHADVDGSVVIVRLPGRRYTVEYDRTELGNVARKTKKMPDEFIARSGNDVTRKFLAYARPLVGRLPAVGYLEGI
jgi:6-phosphofructokinase 1